MKNGYNMDNFLYRININIRYFKMNNSMIINIYKKV